MNKIFWLLHVSACQFSYFLILSTAYPADHWSSKNEENVVGQIEYKMLKDSWNSFQTYLNTLDIHIIKDFDGFDPPSRNNEDNKYLDIPNPISWDVKNENFTLSQGEKGIIANWILIVSYYFKELFENNKDISGFDCSYVSKFIQFKTVLDLYNKIIPESQNIFLSGHWIKNLNLAIDYQDQRLELEDFEICQSLINHSLAELDKSLLINKSFSVLLSEDYKMLICRSFQSDGIKNILLENANDENLKMKWNIINEIEDEKLKCHVTHLFYLIYKLENWDDVPCSLISGISTKVVDIIGYIASNIIIDRYILNR
ncbi:MAG: hypothetical protein MHPSP_000774 [Paramarteilia canceri]